MYAEPIKRWLDMGQIWGDKYAKQNRKVRRAREREYLDASNRGLQYGDVMGETPPPSALAGRPSVQKERARDQGGKNENVVGWMWGAMGGKEDQKKESVKKPHVVRQSRVPVILSRRKGA